MHNIPWNFIQKREKQAKKNLKHVTNVSRSHLVGALNRLMPNKNISTVKHFCLIISLVITITKLSNLIGYQLP